MADRGGAVVIVGAGQAGGRLAATLRELGHAGPVTVIGDEPHLPYERPPLSKEILTGAMDPATAQLGDAGYWQALDVTAITGVAATGIETEARRVVLRDGRTVAYDDLVLATGASPRTLPGLDLPGDGPARGAVQCLRTLDDSLALRAGLTAGARLAVIGAGVIGLELAASARGLGVEVTVVEAADRVMGRVVTPAVGARLLALHRDAGVRFRFGAMTGRLEVEEGRLRLHLRDGPAVQADRVVIAIGVVPNDALAAAAGIAVADGIVVDGAGRSSVPGIWAVGDVARHPAVWAPGGRVRQETWRHAENHARAVAAALLGQGADYDEVPGFWSDQYDRRFQAEGTTAGREVLRDEPGGGFWALYLAEDGRINGCVVLDNPKVAGLVRKAIMRGAVVDPEALAAPGADPRKLLKG